MSKKRTATIAAAGVAVGLLVFPVQSALAGHLNEVVEADLSGGQEVPAEGVKTKLAGDPNGIGEVYVFGIDDLRESDGQGGFTTESNGDTLCYILEVDRVSGTENNPGAPYAAHIHRGEPGSNGPVVVNLAFPTGGEAADCVTETRVGAAPGNVPVFVRSPGGALLATAQEILANPHDFYVNVHNADYPSGAVRGQLDHDDH